MYCEWRLATNNQGDTSGTSKKVDKELVASIRVKLKAIEDDYPAEKIIVLRKFGTKLVKQKLDQMRSE